LQIDFLTVDLQDGMARTGQCRMADGLRKGRSLVGECVGRTVVVCDVEIATTLALPVGTVSSRLRRARELFQAAVRRRAARNGGVR